LIHDRERHRFVPGITLLRDNTLCKARTAKAGIVADTGIDRLSANLGPSVSPGIYY
jgi:hypothetical protein